MPQWLNVLIGGIGGAVLSGGVAMVLYVLQRRASTRSAKGAGRIIHGELMTNIAALTAGLNSRPIRLLFSTSAWEQHSPAIAGLLDEVDLLKVIAAYQIPEAYRSFFAQGGLALVLPRLLGDDRKMVADLLDRVQTAEGTLRPYVWSRKRRERLTEAIRMSVPALGRPARVGRRVLTVIATPPIGPIIIGACLAWLFRSQLARLLGLRRRTRWSHLSR